MIRKASLRDLPFIISLSRKAFSPYGRYELAVAKWFFMPGVHTFVHQEEELHNDLTGFITLAYFKEENSENSLLEIMAIAIADEFQNRGIGTALLEFSVHFLKATWPKDKGQPKLRLSVAASNKARIFFQNFGFRIIGEADWKYPAGQTALKMEYSV